jgi:mevalonate kinase
VTRATANGKVILLGEHACVYGAPALAAALDRGATATATPTDGASSLALGADTLAPAEASTDDRARAFAALLAAGSVGSAVHVVASSELPPGGGLGSSAALGVAIGRVVTAVRLGHDDEQEAVVRASAWEGVFHGNPSGIDVAVASRGGCVRFVRGAGCDDVAPARDLTLCVGWTGAGASTREMVAGVASLRARKPAVVDRAVEAVTSLVSNAALALAAGDLQGLGKLMDLNQMVLAGLMVSTETIEALCALARGAGALGAKLTGAGGGGSVIALAPDDDGARHILAAWQEAGFSGFSTRVRARTSGFPPTRGDAA